MGLKNKDDMKSYAYISKQNMLRIIADSLITEIDFTPLNSIAICNNKQQLVPMYYVLLQNSTDSITSSLINYETTAETKQEVPKKSWIKLTGSFLYDYNYVSRLDTPFVQNNFQQHTLQSKINFLVKDHYPLRLFFTVRLNNTPFMQNVSGVNFQFKNTDFIGLVNNKLYQEIENKRKIGLQKIDSLHDVLNTKKSLLDSLLISKQKIAAMQSGIEALERDYVKKQVDISKQAIEDSTQSIIKRVGGGISAVNYLGRGGQQIKHESTKVDSFMRKDTLIGQPSAAINIELLKREYDSLMQKYRILKQAQQLRNTSYKANLFQSDNYADVVSQLKANNIADTIIPKGYKYLAAIQKVGIGRSFVDYSELSVKNCQLTGFTVDYNPKYYYALAIGKINYNYRNYFTNFFNNGQNLLLLRFGKGYSKKAHLYFTYYTGNKALSNSFVSNTITKTNLQKINGFTVEGNIQFNKNIQLLAEVAKSAETVQQLSKFDGIADMAYSLKLNTVFNKMNTKFGAGIVTFGDHFNSFSITSIGSSRSIMYAKLEQRLFKHQLTVNSSLQKNDFNNHLVSTNYNNSLLLVNIQASLRMKKLPLINIGYYPSYQLTVNPKNEFTESRYFTFMANAWKSYVIHDRMLNVGVTYNQFYTTSSDTLFAFSNSNNYMLTTNYTSKNIAYAVNWSLTKNSSVQFSTIEQSAQYLGSEKLHFGAGIKLMKQLKDDNVYIGYLANIQYAIKHIGQISINADKSFIPDYLKGFRNMYSGNVTFYKNF